MYYLQLLLLVMPGSSRVICLINVISLSIHVCSLVISLHVPVIYSQSYDHCLPSYQGYMI